MAKGQKRSNKEVRKPKAVKTAAAPPPSTMLTKLIEATSGAPKKKK